MIKSSDHFENRSVSDSSNAVTYLVHYEYTALTDIDIDYLYFTFMFLSTPVTNCVMSVFNKEEEEEEDDDAYYSLVTEHIAKE